MRNSFVHQHETLRSFTYLAYGWAFLIKICPMYCRWCRPRRPCRCNFFFCIFHISIFFSKTTYTGLISTKLDRNHNWVERIQVFFNEAPSFFKGDDLELLKLLVFLRKNLSKNHITRKAVSCVEASLGKCYLILISGGPSAS